MDLCERTATRILAHITDASRQRPLEIDEWTPPLLLLFLSLSLALALAEQIHESEDNQGFRTLVHGDFKAMNVFVPTVESSGINSGGGSDGGGDGDGGGAGTGSPQGSARGGGAALIDFQWTDVGLGMLGHYNHDNPIPALLACNPALKILSEFSSAD
eukprot:SAG22_NODE_249_length_13894_cov_60.455455_3_plen_158_part_00